MPARTKRTVGKEISQMKIFIRESCTFTDPVATSSPNVDKKHSKLSASVNLLPLKRTLETLGEKEIKEEIDKIETFEEELKKKCDLLRLSIDPELQYYSCGIENTSKLQKIELNTNKRQREDELLMPPPSLMKNEVKRAGKKIRSESENTKTSELRPVQTRTSSRLLAQSLNSETVSHPKNEALLENDCDMKTPTSKGLLRRNRHNIATVTPGPNIDAPQTILRRPNPGETAISLSGSPLLVASDQTSSLPQITIPLRDGRVMAVLARDGLNPADFPNMDSQTLSRLKLLHEFLGKL